MGPLNRQLTSQQVAQRQQMAGKISGVAEGVGALLGQGLGMIKEAKSIQTAAPSAQVDSFGKPIYNLGNFQSQVSAIKPQGATGGELLSSAAQGAQAGAAFGPWGAVIGGTVGLVSSALFGKRRKTLQQRRKSLANQNLVSAQRLYNTGIESFNARESAQNLYEQNSGISEQRINNVYQALS